MHDLRVHETSVYYIRYYESHIIKMRHTLRGQGGGGGYLGVRLWKMSLNTLLIEGVMVVI